MSEWVKVTDSLPREEQIVDGWWSYSDPAPREEYWGDMYRSTDLKFIAGKFNCWESCEGRWRAYGPSPSHWMPRPDSPEAA